MAAPVIVWRKLTGTVSGPSYASIASLDFGTVTAGMWSLKQCVAPKVTVNSIQSCKWWLYDVNAVRSGASEGIGTADGWLHRMTVTATYIKPSAAMPSAGWGTESPQTTGSAYAYPAIAPGAYGRFTYLALKVASAAGDGATTSWGYQLKYSYT